LIQDELAFIDFAFAFQQCGEELDCPLELDDGYMAACAVIRNEGLDDDMCYEIWFPHDEEER
jgi:hypothetical protein